jgi:hypothetical protein
MNKKHGLFLGFAALLLAAIFTLAGCDPSTTPSGTEWVDAYTSATAQGTKTKEFLSGEDLEAARDELVLRSDTFATMAEKDPGNYASDNPENRLIQAMSINPDGSVNNSSVGVWKYTKGTALRDDTVTLSLTHGQTSENYENRKGGTVLMQAGEASPFGSNYYLVHVRLKSISKQPFDQDAFDKGEFSWAYSGAPEKLSSDTVILDVLSIEKSTLMMF